MLCPRHLPYEPEVEDFASYALARKPRKTVLLIQWIAKELRVVCTYCYRRG
jgi:hypothetical protein